MGDPRLLQRSLRVDAFGTPGLEELMQDLRDTMAARNGAGLAAPQIGVLRQVVIFGVESNERYPDAEPVPYTELVNPVLTPLADAIDEDWEGCLSVPGLRGVVPRYAHLRYEGFDPAGRPIRRDVTAWSSTNATICSASCIRCACATCPGSASPKSCSPTARPTNRQGRMGRGLTPNLRAGHLVPPVQSRNCS